MEMSTHTIGHNCMAIIKDLVGLHASLIGFQTHSKSCYIMLYYHIMLILGGFLGHDEHVLACHGPLAPRLRLLDPQATALGSSFTAAVGCSWFPYDLTPGDRC